MQRLLFFFTLLSCSSLFSQATEIANLNFQKLYGETETGDTYNTNRLDASLLLGFDLKKDKSTVFFRPSYQQRILEGASEARLYKTELIAGLSQNSNNTWNYRVFGVARLATDFDDLNSEHYQFGGGTLIRYSKTDRLNFKFGGYARNQPNGVLIFPLLGLDFKSGNTKWYLDVLFPQYALLKYELSQKQWFTGIRLSYVTEQYKRSEAFLPSDYIELSEFQTELFVEYYLSKNLVAFSRFGVLNTQKYEVFDSDGELLNEGFETVKNPLSFRVGLAFRLQTTN